MMKLAIAFLLVAAPALAKAPPVPAGPPQTGMDLYRLCSSYAPECEMFMLGVQAEIIAHDPPWPPRVLSASPPRGYALCGRFSGPTLGQMFTMMVSNQAQFWPMPAKEAARQVILVNGRCGL